jgi:hypothetical protein
MHQRAQLNRRVSYGTLVMLERSAAKVARCVLRGERSREAPDLPGAGSQNTRVPATFTPERKNGPGIRDRTGLDANNTH